MNDTSKVNSEKIQSEIEVRDYDPNVDTPEDVARVWSEGFGALEKKTGITEDLKDFEVSLSVAKHCVADCYGFLAVTKDGKVVGANFLTKSDELCIEQTNLDAREIGPIAVMPGYQGHNIGRRLMQSAIQKSTTNNSHHISLRLLVDTHNPVSFSLYLSIGFIPKQTVTCLIKRPKPISLTIPSHLRCRKLTSQDISECNALAKHITGVFCNNLLKSRTNNEEITSRWSIPFVLEEVGEHSKIVAFCSGFSIEDFSVAKSEDYFKYLFAFVSTHFEFEDKEEQGVPYILIDPVQYPSLLKWLLSTGMIVEKNMFYMVYGEYTQVQSPHVYLSSVGGFL